MAERGQSEKESRHDFDNSSQNLPNESLHTDANSSKNNDSNDSDDEAQRKGTANRGFAAMDSEKQKRIASEGGRAAHKQGVAHEWSRDEARAAGRKGGQMVSKNREHMSEIGRKGGQSSGQRRGGQKKESSDS